MLTGEQHLAKLDTPQKVVITMHHKPDGDAMGSSLGLYHFLQAKGHQVHVIAPSDYPDFLHWLPGNDQVIEYTSNRRKSRALLSQADIIFCLDFSALSRLMEMKDAVASSPAQKWVIDHHLSPETFADLMYWDSSAAATAQLIYTFITSVLGEKDSITEEIATSLYTGIMTDTGSFRFRSTTSEVHKIVAQLIDCGARNWQIHENVFNTNSEKRLKFLGFCLSERLVVLPEYNTAYISLSREDLIKFQITTGDTEGLVNYALSIKGIRLAALIVDRTELIKLSLRSLGEIPCNEICSKYFGGGGHLNASGGSSLEPLEKVIERFKSILPEYKELLIKQ